MKNKTKFIFLFSLVLTILIIQNVLAYTKLCLLDCQGTPADNPRYTCELGRSNSCGDPGHCEVCVTDAGNPTNLNRCLGQTCSIFGDGNDTLDPNKPNLTVINPLNGSTYGDKSMDIIVDVDSPSKVEYMDMNDQRRGWKVLCNSCTHAEKSGRFNEGNNDILIKATKNSNEQTDEKEIIFNVDSKTPKIHKTFPKRKAYGNGEFTIEYTELNLALIKLFYGTESDPRSLDMGFCSSGERQSCSATVDLGDFQGQEIGYYFLVFDSANLIQSRLTNILVDQIAPNLLKVNVTNEGRNVYFDIEIDEERSKIEYMDLSDRRPRFQTLCSNKLICNKSRRFKEGEHDLIIRAIDKAENSDEEELILVI